MVIAILPPGYAFDGPEGCDWPTKAKIVGERLAIYWIFGGNETVEPAWRIAPTDDVARLVECAATINHRPSPLELPEPPVPSTAELHEWAERRTDRWKGDQMTTPEQCAGTRGLAALRAQCPESLIRRQ